MIEAGRFAGGFRLGVFDRKIPVLLVNFVRCFVLVCDLVILLGDGIATFGETAPEKLAAAAVQRLEARGARFHALALGARHDRLLLREVARRTGGLYRSIVPGDNVAAAAKDLVQALRSADRLGHASAHLREFFGEECHAIAVRYSALLRYVKYRRAEGAAGATIRLELAALKRAYKLAATV
ncbi:MAG: hypothetical protein IIB71_14225, partial [Proteobacteria bacterium]|nr:hypothetical protein [Pseudomonadota bacterium]